MYATVQSETGANQTDFEPQAEIIDPVGPQGMHFNLIYKSCPCNLALC